MEVLTQREIEPALLDLMRRYPTYEWAVAWASMSFGSAELLAKQSHRIRRLVVGTHFHQTHPDFLERFHTIRDARFVMSPQGVFHPKVYLFSGEGKWEALVGSANFTRGAFHDNQEVVVRIGSADDASGDALRKLRSSIEAYWEGGKPLTRADVDGYRVIWERLAPTRDRLAGIYRSKEKNTSDGGTSVIETDIGRRPWAEYFRSVKNDQLKSFEQRIGLIRAMRGFFQAQPSFKDMDEQTRKRVAGTTSEKKVPQDWHFFGSMIGAGYFKKLVAENSARLSDALDAIPAEGDVSRADYDTFMRGFASAFEGMDRGGGGIATSTRLLAMKRPDQFVCMDSRNLEGLCKAFKLPQRLDRDEYWDRLVLRIRDCAWWKSEPPTDPEELAVWQARAAFMDSLFYEEIAQ